MAARPWEIINAKLRNVAFGSQKRVPKRFWVEGRNDENSALRRVMWWQCLECTRGGMGGKKIR